MNTRGRLISPRNIFPAGPALLGRAIASIAVFAILLAGCRGNLETFGRAQHRAATDEIVATARKVAGHNLKVTIRPENPRGGSSADQFPVDEIYLSLTDPSQQVALSRALPGIAENHGLSIVEISSGDVERFDLAFHGKRTHVVHLITPLAGHAFPSGSEKPELAVILDDLGNDRSAAAAVLALPFPLTVSVLPHLAFSAEIAEEAYRRGDQVLLHLPMEPESASAKAEPDEIRAGMDPSEVRSTLNEMLASVPHAAGVNNHEGSRATADLQLMRELMPAIRERGLFFVDSRTTAATVAYDAAERSGVPAASRKVFLDDIPERDAVLAQLKVAAQDALRDGSAIAIGHPHPATIAALEQGVPEVEAGGIRLVFVSGLVH